MSGERAVVWLAARVRELRQERGWSVPELAEATGLAVGVVEAIEGAELSASLDDLRALAVAFRLLLSELFEGLESVEGRRGWPSK